MLCRIQMQNLRKNNKNRLKDYVKYSNIGIQMMLIIVLGTFGGFKLDEYLNWGFPLFVILFSLLSVAIAIYIGIKDVIKKK